MTALEMTAGVIAVAVPLITALGWLFKVDGRVTTHEEWRKGHIEEHKQFREEYREDSREVRDKLDTIIGKLGGQ